MEKEEERGGAREEEMDNRKEQRTEERARDKDNEGERERGGCLISVVQEAKDVTGESECVYVCAMCVCVCCY